MIQTIDGGKMEKLTLETLEKKLWDCADILRGTLNSSQYMEYIFGMLFLKRINDQFSVERREKEEKFAKLPVEAREKGFCCKKLKKLKLGKLIPNFYRIYATTPIIFLTKLN